MRFLFFCFCRAGSVSSAESEESEEFCGLVVVVVVFVVVVVDLRFRVCVPSRLDVVKVCLRELILRDVLFDMLERVSRECC